jgi:hypothetical protein
MSRRSGVAAEADNHSDVSPCRINDVRVRWCVFGVRQHAQQNLSWYHQWFQRSPNRAQRPYAELCETAESLEISYGHGSMIRRGSGPLLGRLGSAAVKGTTLTGVARIPRVLA